MPSLNNRLVTGALMLLSALCATILTVVMMKMDGPTDTEPPQQFEASAVTIENAPVAPVLELAPDPHPVAPEAPIRVSASGAVIAPGMYELHLGDRVHHLVEKAGGTTEDADLRDINLAAPLIDGATLTIPAVPVTERENRSLVIRGGAGSPTYNPVAYTRSGWGPAERGVARSGQRAVEPPAKGSAGDALLDLNTATQAELESLPGIGPVTARKILDYRNTAAFGRVQDLMNVPGIGPKKLEAVQHLVTVR